jgi:hypothetical protein
MTNPAISASTFIYSRALRCYPPVLRDQFAQDMIAVFSERLEDAWSRDSWRGVARAWLAVIDDLVGIVLPYRAARAWPVLLALVCSIVVYGSLFAAISPNRYCHK